MNTPLPEHRRVKITTGAHTTSDGKIKRLASSHPFTRQLDLVFPSSNALETALCKLETRYAKGKVRLSELVAEAEAFVGPLGLESEFAVLSTGVNEDDVWCVDPRGVLTLSVSKDRYERLGLVGKKMPFKHYSDRHVIQLPLQKNSETTANQSRRNTALKTWDTEREARGLGPWDVLYYSDVPSAKIWLTGNRPHDLTRSVKPQVTKLTDVHIPIPSLAPYPESSSNDDQEDWNAEMSAIFEWVGMACLGAQRLKANDRVDPYVALFEPPAPSRIGDITHLRWTGLLSPSFVQSVIDTTLDALKAGPGLSTPFASITSHAFSASPVAYIPPSALTRNTGTTKKLDMPMRMPREGGEDTWSVLIVPSTEDEPELTTWVMVESLGQYDTRWG